MKNDTIMEKMLVATDLSEGSERVVGALGSLRALGTREAVLLHCMNLRKSEAVPGHLTDFVEPWLQGQQETLAAQGFSARSLAVPGRAQIEIDRQAREHGCSFIVAGSHGESLTSEVMLGSIAGAVIHSATLPVLLMRLPLRCGSDGPDGTCLHHVLFATDFSAHAEHAFGHVRHAAACGAETITLLHVCEEREAPPAQTLEQVERNRLHRYEEELKEAGAKRVECVVVAGSAKKMILDHLRNADVTLVIMGSKGRGAIDELLLGSVSHAVARCASVPVMLVPMTH